MKRRLLFALAFVALGLSATSGHSADPEQVAPFMRLKLAHSEKLLEGIALEDFPLIEKHEDQKAQVRAAEALLGRFMSEGGGLLCRAAMRVRSASGLLSLPRPDVGGRR